ncbi:MAG: hypothetical protein D6715_08080 [Calditrichaeota bacterium]|nr:MAG: hypothetical protein D6715_08080 [Calditrichota bacterium]
MADPQVKPVVAGEVESAFPPLQKGIVGDDQDCQCGIIKSEVFATVYSNVQSKTAGSNASAGNSPLFVWTGTVSGGLNGDFFYSGFLGDRVAMASANGNDPINKALSYSGTWTLDSKHGKLTLRDLGILEVEGGGHGVSYSHVIDGTGCYEGASGILSLVIKRSSNGRTLSARIDGRLHCPNLTKSLSTTE